MFGNYQELSPGFIIRRIRNSDIFDVIKFYFIEWFLRDNELHTRDKTIKEIKKIPVIFGLQFIGIWSITGDLYFAFDTTLFLLIFIILIVLGTIYYVWNKNVNSGKCLVIFHQNKICAVIAASSYNHYSYIDSLFISSLYRRRGLGTYLINRTKQNLDYPIYLLCFPEPYLVEFYSNLGFISIEDNELPRRIREYLDNFNQVKSDEAAPFIPMILEEN
ncbi:MAG: GNAT family N-acetyltransferase [Cyanobacteriota bacterium]|nr:GNAT family N-acetyltransferase [Cyanobacteriota bacterium]